MRTHATLTHPAPLQPTLTPELQVDSDLVPELYNEGAPTATPPLQDTAPPVVNILIYSPFSLYYL